MASGWRMAERDQPEGEGAMTIDGTFSLGDCLTLCNMSASLVLAPDLRMQGLCCPYRSLHVL